MPIRSMTGFAAVAGEASGGVTFTLSLKAVNHRFLDLSFRMPSGRDALELAIRRQLKGVLSRGHVDVTLSLNKAETSGEFEGVTSG